MPQPTTINPPQRPRTTVLTDATGVNAVTTDGLGNLNVNVQAGGGGGGSNPAAAPTGAPVPADADYIGAKDNSGNLVGLSTDGSGNLNVNLAAGTITGGNAAASATGAGVPASADYTGFNKAGNLVGVSSSNPLPVDGSGVIQPVSGTVAVSNFPATQPVSGTVAVSNFPATQPVSGTVTVSGTVAVSSVGGTVAVSAASLPLPSGASSDATVANVQVSSGTTTGPTKIEIIGGKTSDATAQYQPLPLTNSGAAVKTDGSATTQPVSGSVSVSNFPATQPVSGSVSVSNFPGTQAVSGTVTGNQGTAAVVANAWPIKVTDGTNAVTVASLTNSKALAVEIVDGAGTQITSFGGGTQFADNAASGATPTGTLSMGWDSANSKVRALKVDASQNLDVNVQAGSVSVSNFPATQPVSGSVSVSNFPATQPISGTVTANIGSVGTLALDASVTGLQVAQGSTTSGEKGTLVQGAVTTAAPAYTTAQTSPLSLNTAGGLRVDGSSVTQPISGSVSISNTPAVTLASTTITGTVASTQSTSPWVDNITQVASTVLGVPQTFGTAPTGVVIGTSSDIYIAGTRARSNQTTTAAGVQDVNIVGTLGVSNSVTNGTFSAITDNTTKVGVIAGTTALKTDLSSVAGTATVAAAAGIQKVGISGNAGASVDATLAAGTAPTNGVAQLNQFNTTAPTLTAAQTASAQCDVRGNLLVSTQGRKATYRMASTGLAAVAGNSVTLYGSASKTVVITKIRICMSAATAALGVVSVNKYSTVPSGGTSTTTAMVPVDATDGAATATANNKYTVAPTAGTLIGLLDTTRGLMGSATVTGNFAFELDFGGVGAKPIVLSGTTQGIALNVVVAGTLDFMVEWTEE